MKKISVYFLKLYQKYISPLFSASRISLQVLSNL